MRALSLVLLAGLTLATFAGVLEAGWVPLDDPYYVLQNPIVSRGFSLGGALHFLTHPHANNWHPLTTWSHMLDVTMFGLVPFGHHAMNLVLHVANAVLLAIVLFRLTGAWWRSVLVAALFALHPLRVESVAWISERKDVLSTLWFLLAIEAYRRWVERPDARRMLMVAAAFTLGLMAKPMVVTLPLVLVLLDVWPLGRWAGGEPRAAGPAAFHARARPLGGLLLEKWPLFAIAAASAVVTFMVQQRTGAVTMQRFPFPLRVANALQSYWAYVGQLLWPRGLAIFYPYPRSIAAASTAAAAVGLVAATAFAFVRARARPYGLAGWLWFAGMLLPVIGLIQVGIQARADRYTYIPSIGLLVAIVWVAADHVPRAARVAGAVAVAIVVAALAITTARQVSVWRDPPTLFAHALAVTRDNAVAEQGLGNALMDVRQPRAAIPHLEAALRLEPDLPDVENTLGSALGMLGRYDEAARRFRQALERHDTAQLHQNLASALAGGGRLDEAIAEFQRALELDPGNREIQDQLAEVQAEKVRVGQPK